MPARERPGARAFHRVAGHRTSDDFGSQGLTEGRSGDMTAQAYSGCKVKRASSDDIKSKAVLVMVRKLAVLPHRLWSLQSPLTQVIGPKIPESVEMLVFDRI